VFLNDSDTDARFNYSRTDMNVSQLFSFNLKYYVASRGNDTYPDSDNNAEGAYLLKPDSNMPHQFNYSDYLGCVEFEQGYYIAQWTFKYYDNVSDEYAYAKVIFAPYYNELIEFKVELNGIPVMKDGDGKDVTVDWYFYDFEANNTFWTDSNGLEMQERILNYRPTWNYSGDQNISANYYPVGSGIAMRDINSARQVTIVNERAQAGSANLIPNSIELIQNRRLLYDDNRGVGEALNETGPDGYGLQINARYWLQIHDRSTSHSMQRQQQLKVDLPLQYFFCFDYT